LHRRGGFVRHQWSKKALTQVYVAAVCGNLGLALRLNLESTRSNVTNLTLHLKLPIVRTAALRALGAMPLRKIFEVSGSAKSKKRSGHPALDRASRWMLSSAKSMFCGSRTMSRCQWTCGVFLPGLRDIKSHRVSALRMPYHSWQSWNCDEVKQGDVGSNNPMQCCVLPRRRRSSAPL
jgi:hypothetical protein